MERLKRRLDRIGAVMVRVRSGGEPELDFSELTDEKIRFLGSMIELPDERTISAEQDRRVLELLTKASSPRTQGMT
jgi:hypothetical protein